MRAFAHVVARRVLIAEDDGLIADSLVELLSDEGCRVTGPVGTVADAFRALRMHGSPDLALLDVKLGNDPVFPFADALVDLRVPVVFMSGYGRDSLPERFANAPLVGKPYSFEEIVAALSSYAGGPAGAP